MPAKHFLPNLFLVVVPAEADVSYADCLPLSTAVPVSKQPCSAVLATGTADPGPYRSLSEASTARLVLLLKMDVNTPRRWHIAYPTGLRLSTRGTLAMGGGKAWWLLKGWLTSWL